MFKCQRPNLTQKRNIIILLEKLFSIDVTESVVKEKKASGQFI